MKIINLTSRVGKTTVFDRGFEIFGVRFLFRTMYSRGYQFGPNLVIEKTT